MKLWIARDKHGGLYVYESKPVRRDYYWIYPQEEIHVMVELPCGWFPSVTWENSPQEVELKLIEK